MPSLSATFGRGAATSYQEDLQNSDCILIMGSNMAEAHPVGFRFVMKARENGAKVIHVDPHFSRTSACATQYVPIRSGTDIVFLGGIINQVLTQERWFKEYVQHYTNASTIINEGYVDAEDNGGIFSGFDKEQGLQPAQGELALCRAGATPAADVPEHAKNAVVVPNSAGKRREQARARPHIPAPQLRTQHPQQPLRPIHT